MDVDINFLLLFLLVLQNTILIVVLLFFLLGTKGRKELAAHGESKEETEKPSQPEHIEPDIPRPIQTIDITCKGLRKTELAEDEEPCDVQAIVEALGDMAIHVDVKEEKDVFVVVPKDFLYAEDFEEVAGRLKKFDVLWITEGEDSHWEIKRKERDERDT